MKLFFWRRAKAWVGNKLMLMGASMIGLYFDENEREKIDSLAPLEDIEDDLPIPYPPVSFSDTAIRMRQVEPEPRDLGNHEVPLRGSLQARISARRGI